MKVSFAFKNSERIVKKKIYIYLWQIHALSVLEKAQWSKVESLSFLTVIWKTKASKDKGEKTLKTQNNAPIT